MASGNSAFGDDLKRIFESLLDEVVHERERTVGHGAWSERLGASRANADHGLIGEKKWMIDEGIHNFLDGSLVSPLGIQGHRTLIC